jgi:hypothetical protein
MQFSPAQIPNVGLGKCRDYALMSDSCVKCGTEIRPNERACSNCGKDAGFPNVRAAKSPEERAALGARFQAAQVLAVARGITLELDAFIEAVNRRSHPVVNRSLGSLNSWAEGSNPLFNSFHCQFETMGRTPNGSNYDQQREAAEAVINPFCYREISYAALTLNETGLINYGPYSVLLKEMSIDERSSVFQENPFEFNQKHHVVAGQNPPLGYRAPWEERGTLAGAKLEHKLERGMQPSAFPGVLMEERGTDPDCDYVEVHIFGPVSRVSIQKVSGPKPARSIDAALWRRTVRTLEKLGVEVEETP